MSERLTSQSVTGPDDEYMLLSRCGGNGKYGGIWVVRSVKHGNLLTLKRIERYGEQLPALLNRLSSLESHFVARTYGSFFGEDGCLYVVREYVQGTDLKSIFTNKKVYGKIDEAQFLRMGCSVLRALSAVHSVGIVHRDVKPSNIILRHAEGADVTKCDFSEVALTDFEQCAAFPDMSGVRSAFALVYSPPEMLLKYNSLVGPPSDLFALSVALFQLIMGKAPYTDCNPEILINLQLTYPMKQPARMSDDLFAVLSKAAYKASFRLPPRRLTAEEIEDTLRQGVEGRYQTASAMLADLEKVVRPFKKVGWWTKTFGG